MKPIIDYCRDQNEIWEEKLEKELRDANGDFYPECWREGYCPEHGLGDGCEPCEFFKLMDRIKFDCDKQFTLGGNFYYLLRKRGKREWKVAREKITAIGPGKEIRTRERWTEREQLAHFACSTATEAGERVKMVNEWERVRNESSFNFKENA